MVFGDDWEEVILIHIEVLSQRLCVNIEVVNPS